MKDRKNQGNVTKDNTDISSKAIGDTVLRVLKRHDRDCFDSPQPDYKAEALKLALPVIRQIATAVSQGPHDVGLKTQLLKIRSEIATTAQALNIAMEPIWERTPSQLGIRSDKSSVRVLKLALARLNGHPKAATSAVLHALVERAVAAASTSASPDDDGDVALGGAVRCRLTVVSLLLQRASGCLWTEVLLRRFGGSGDTLPTRNGQVRRTVEQAAAYLGALRKFADAITALRDVDLTSLPVGDEAVVEAPGLCVVRDFVRRRHDELRRWVHPRAVANGFISGEIESSADLGEQVIMASLGSSPDSSAPSNWTWHNPDPTDPGDMLRNLHHVADTAGVDFDEAEGNGDWLYQCELDEQKDELPAVPAVGSNSQFGARQGD